MVSKILFSTSAGGYVRPTDTVNLAGGSAYALTDKQALAQYVMTGCLGSTFYADANAQVVDILELAKRVDAEFVAKLAVKARRDGYMKDTPALLAAYLSVNIGKEFLPKIFPRVIDNGRMLRNYVQIIRSGRVGRKSFGSLPRRLIREYLEDTSTTQLFRDSVGNDPSLADIIKMVHPKPVNYNRAAFYKYLIGKLEEGDKPLLPESVQNLLRFRAGQPAALAGIEFRLLTERGLTLEQWKEVVRSMGWHALRINLNVLNKAGVLADKDTLEFVANKLASKEEIKRAKVFPYQLFTAYKHTTDVPVAIREALQDAMEIATENVPAFDVDTVVVCPDVSGSMQAPVTGYRGSVSSKVTCVDVAALVSSCILRVNRGAMVLPFDTTVHNVGLNPRDTVMTNASKLSIGGGGTNCSVPMRVLASARGDIPKKVLVIYVSDNESWAHDVKYYWDPSSTMMQEWAKFKSRSPESKLVCIDLTPNRTTQAYSGPDVLNIGGFSDQVFTVIEQFARGAVGGDHWVSEIEKVVL